MSSVKIDQILIMVKYIGLINYINVIKYIDIDYRTFIQSIVRCSYNDILN